VPEIPGFTVDRNGFVAKFGASERFYFAEPAPGWTVKSTSDVEETIDLGKAAGPATLRVSLLAPGFMLQFPKGFALSLRSTSAPFLSWREGSVGEHVPTPSVRWIAISFKGGQPPLVLGFLDSEVSLRIDGQVGDWTLRTEAPYKGWVRVALPNGTQPIATDSAASLGRLSNAVADFDAIWWQTAPQVKELRIEDEETAVEATWIFDRKGAVVPLAAAMSRLGRYPLTIHSKTQRLPGYTSEGPTTICLEDSLRIRFPITRVPLGRSLTLGAPNLTELGTVSAFDVKGIVELALENLVASRDLQSVQTAEKTVKEFIESVQYAVEPHTSQSLPFPENGTGIDIVAANAMLHQAYSMSSRASSQDNALLTSVGWRRDWYTWRIWGGDAKVSRRAAAFAAIAGLLCAEPERRLAAAMMQAGLAGERGLGIYFARIATPSEEPTFIEPLSAIRKTLFGMATLPQHRSAFALALTGTVRIFGDTAVTCTAVSGSERTELSWSDSDSITLASGSPLIVDGSGIVSRHILGYTTIRSSDAGRRSAILALPSWMPRLPNFVAPPVYDEPLE
jgi:hypothetical protein